MGEISFSFVMSHALRLLPPNIMRRLEFCDIRAMLFIFITQLWTYRYPL